MKLPQNPPYSGSARNQPVCMLGSEKSSLVQLLRDMCTHRCLVVEPSGGIAQDGQQSFNLCASFIKCSLCIRACIRSCLSLALLMFSYCASFWRFLLEVLGMESSGLNNAFTSCEGINPSIRDNSHTLLSHCKRHRTENRYLRAAHRSISSRKRKVQQASVLLLIQQDVCVSLHSCEHQMRCLKTFQ